MKVTHMNKEEILWKAVEAAGKLHGKLMREGPKDEIFEELFVIKNQFKFSIRGWGEFVPPVKEYGGWWPLPNGKLIKIGSAEWNDLVCKTKVHNSNSTSKI